MDKMIIFDMDGTIADLYSVNNWLDKLRAFDETPYKNAKPLYDMEILNTLLNKLKQNGYKIVVTSWLSKNSNKEYDKKVRQAKKEWLNKYNFPFDEIHLVKYGTPKAYCTKGKANFQILVDDNSEVRLAFENYKSAVSNKTIDAKENIIPELYKLL